MCARSGYAKPCACGGTVTCRYEFECQECVDRHMREMDEE